MARNDRRAMREELAKRTQESHERKDGDVFLKYFLSDSDLPMWKCGVTKDDPHIIDIIPFLAGPNFPTGSSKYQIKPGTPVYVLDLYVHQNIGPGEAWIVCPAKNYGKPCPVCEDIERRKRKGEEWDDYSDIAPKRRCVYNVICYDNKKEEDKGIQIWEVSHRYSEKAFQALAKNARTGDVISFCSPDKDGKSISFEVSDDDFRTIGGHKFLDRDYEITDDVLDQAYILDEQIALLTYKEIENLYFGEDEKPEPETRSRGRSREEEPEPETRGRGRGRGREEEPEKDTETDKETRGGGRLSRRTRPENEDKPAEEETTKRGRGGSEGSSRKSKNTCPVEGGNFGLDIDMYKECEECSLYSKCADESEEIEKKRREQRDANRGGRGRK